jgi:hypothetical protein
MDHVGGVPLGADAITEAVIRANGWQGQVKVYGGGTPQQRRIVHGGRHIWIGVDGAFRHAHLVAGRVEPDGTFADVEADNVGRIDVTDTEAVTTAVAELTDFLEKRRKQ